MFLKYCQRSRLYAFAYIYSCFGERTDKGLKTCLKADNTNDIQISLFLKFEISLTPQSSRKKQRFNSPYSPTLFDRI